MDPAALVAALATTVGTDAVDLVDLTTASAPLRFRAARDGIVVVGVGDARVELELGAVLLGIEVGQPGPVGVGSGPDAGPEGASGAGVTGRTAR